MKLLRNHAAGAPWTPRFFSLDEKRAIWSGAGKAAARAGIAGFASTLLTLVDGRLVTRLLAVYLSDDTWMVFDGEREWPAAELSSTWHGGRFVGLGPATLTLRTGTGSQSITYLRPWVRHWFEGGWALEDIDIAHFVHSCTSNPAVLPRLKSVVDAANVEWGPGAAPRK